MKNNKLIIMRKKQGRFIIVTKNIIESISLLFQAGLLNTDQVNIMLDRLNISFILIDEVGK